MGSENKGNRWPSPALALGAAGLNRSAQKAAADFRQSVRLLDPILMPHHHSPDFGIRISAYIIEVILALHVQRELRSLSLS
jgi:hypothetical protein